MRLLTFAFGGCAVCYGKYAVGVCVSVVSILVYAHMPVFLLLPMLLIVYCCDNICVVSAGVVVVYFATVYVDVGAWCYICCRLLYC